MVCNAEDIARLLFFAQMIDDDGKITNAAFSTEELVEQNGRSVSVDRCWLLGEGYYHILKLKAAVLANDEKNRAKYGYATAMASDIRAIIGSDGCPVFDVFPDEIVQPAPDPWDCAHAKLVRARKGLTKGYVRGYRDKLQDLFSKNITLFEK